MKKSIQQPVSESKFHVRIVKHDNYEITREHTESEWDGDDIAHSWDVQGFEVVGEKDSWDFIVNEKPEGLWYLVCAFYSTGDTFHHETGEISLVTFTKHRADAEEILLAIGEDYKRFLNRDKHERRPLKVFLPVSKRVEDIYTGTWKGYFERLESAEVKPLDKAMKVTFSSRRRRY